MLRVMTLILTLSAAGLAVLGIAGELFPVFRVYPISNRIQGYLLIQEGMLRFYWYRCSDPVYLDFSDDMLRVVARRVQDGAICLRLQHVMPGRMPAEAFVAQEFTPAEAHASPVKIVGVRTRLAWPVAGLAIFPLVVFGRDWYRRWRIRPGYCRHCLYDLRGCVSGRCPECGTPFERDAIESGDDVVSDRSEAAPAASDGNSLQRPATRDVGDGLA